MKRLPTVAALCALIALGVTVTSEMTAAPSPVSVRLVAQTPDTSQPSPSPAPTTTPYR